MSRVYWRPCGTCGRDISDEDYFCSDLCEEEAQRRDEESQLDAVLEANAPVVGA